MTSASVPPRFVPTLTDVVHTLDHFGPKQLVSGLEQNAVALEDQIVHRVMQRVDLVLERRLRYSLADRFAHHQLNFFTQARP